MCTQCTRPEPPWLITDRRHLIGVFQHATSSDCGFFAAWALKMWYHANGNRQGNLTTSRADVYAAREQYLRTQLSVTQAVTEHRHNYDMLTHDAAMRYLLTTMRLTGFRRRSVVVSPTVSQTMSQYVRGRFGAMFRILIRGRGHWVSLLKTEAQRLLMYDSSGVTTDRALEWVTHAEFNTTYGNIQSLVGASGPVHP